MKDVVKNLTDRQLKLSSIDGQVGQFGEELAELIVALNHYRRGRVDNQDVLEEMADVVILIEEFKYLLGVEDSEFDDIVNSKLEKWEGQIQDSELPKKHLSNTMHPIDRLTAEGIDFQVGPHFRGFEESMWPARGVMDTLFKNLSPAEFQKQYIGEFTPPAQPEEIDYDKDYPRNNGPAHLDMVYRNDNVYNPLPREAHPEEGS